MKEKNIYLLEDDPDTRSLVTHILEKDGYKVSQFEKVKDFNQQVEKKLPDLFILDVSLPDGNGLDVTKKLVEGHAADSLHVLVMSADHVNQEKALNSGAQSFMRKPFNIKEFLKRVEALLSPDRYKFYNIS